MINTGALVEKIHASIIGSDRAAMDALTDYIIAAVDMVATHGWKLLPDLRSGPTAASGVTVP